MNFQPLKNRIVVLQDEAKTETESGFIIPKAAQERPKEGKVLAIGSEVRDVKVNDRVMFGKHDGVEQKIEGQNVLLMSESHVWGVIDAT